MYEESHRGRHAEHSENRDDEKNRDVSEHADAHRPEDGKASQHRAITEVCLFGRLARPVERG